MKSTMGRVLTRTLAVGVVATLAIPVFATGAYAKGKPSKITLTCDSGVNASGTVQYTTGVLGGTPVGSPIPVSCSSGTTSTTTVTPGSTAKAYSYSLTLSGVTVGGCFGSATRGKTPQPCGPPPTATLTVS